MLTEIRKCRQVGGDRFRRWFSDGRFDLIVWYEDEQIFGFQICYDKGRHEHALTWRCDLGWSHHRVDDGDGVHYKGTPILCPDGDAPITRIVDELEVVDQAVDSELLDFIYAKLPEAREHLR